MLQLGMLLAAPILLDMLPRTTIGKSVTLELQLFVREVVWLLILSNMFMFIQVFSVTDAVIDALSLIMILECDDAAMILLLKGDLFDKFNESVLMDEEDDKW